MATSITFTATQGYADRDQVIKALNNVVLPVLHISTENEDLVTYWADDTITEEEMHELIDECVFTLPNYQVTYQNH